MNSHDSYVSENCAVSFRDPPVASVVVKARSTKATSSGRVNGLLSNVCIGDPSPLRASSSVEKPLMNATCADG